MRHVGGLELRKDGAADATLFNEPPVESRQKKAAADARSSQPCVVTTIKYSKMLACEGVPLAFPLLVHTSVSSLRGRHHARLGSDTQPDVDRAQICAPGWSYRVADLQIHSTEGSSIAPPPWTEDILVWLSGPPEDVYMAYVR